MCHDKLKTVKSITPVMAEDVAQYSGAFKVDNQQRMVFKFIGWEMQVCVLVEGDNNHSPTYSKAVRATLANSGQGAIEVADNGSFHQVSSYKAYDVVGGCSMDLGAVMRRFIEEAYGNVGYREYTRELSGRLYVLFDDGVGQVVISAAGTCVYTLSSRPTARTGACSRGNLFLEKHNARVVENKMYC